jgi:predicted enzyme related to lactoylglutathione lyase
MSAQTTQAGGVATTAERPPSEVTVLPDRRAQAILPSTDPDALRPFYEDVLGFTPAALRPITVFYRAGEGSTFAISRSGIKPAGHTQLSFVVPDLQAEVEELRGRGVVFEEYEMPKTENGIASMPAGRAAWFKDPHGNLLGLIQLDDPI